MLQTPIPFVAKSYREGEVSFNPDTEIRDDWGQWLLANCGSAFECLDGPPVVDLTKKVLCQKDVEDILKYVGKRFSGKAGKWNAIAFIKKHHAEEILGLRKLQIMTQVVHWELVPIALADVKVGDLPEQWNKGKVGSMKQAMQKKHLTRAVTDSTEGATAPIPAMQEG